MARLDLRRTHAGWWAAIAHRLSGIALAVFLPAHFYVLGRALAGEASLDSALVFTEHPAVRIAEWGLVMLLALHLGLGSRVLALEFLPWRRRHKSLAAAAVVVALAVGIAAALELW